MSRYWGSIKVTREGISARKPLADHYALTANVPDWVKVKIAMLDLMGEEGKLPCGSEKVMFQVMKPPNKYYIMEDEDE